MNDWFHSMEDKLESEIKNLEKKPATPAKQPSPEKQPAAPAKKDEEPIVAPNRRQSSVEQARVQMQLKAEAEQKAREVALQKKKKKEQDENEDLSKGLEKLAEDEKLLEGLDRLEKKDKEEIEVLRRKSQNLAGEQGQGQAQQTLDSAPTFVSKNEPKVQEGDPIKVDDEKEKPKEEESDDSPFYRNAVILTALAVAGGFVIYKNFYKH